MDRRGFLSLGRRGQQRVLELSCERLHVRWVDADGRAARTGAEPDPIGEAGEPPTRVAAETREELLAELGRRLRDADVLRVTGAEWLQEPELRREVESRVESFRSSGRRVESDAAIHVTA